MDFLIYNLFLADVKVKHEFFYSCIMATHFFSTLMNVQRGDSLIPIDAFCLSKTREC